MPIDERLAATIDALNLEFDGDRDKIVEALLQRQETNRELAEALVKAGGARALDAYDAELDKAGERMERSMKDNPERAKIAELVAEYLRQLN